MPLPSECCWRERVKFFVRLLTETLSRSLPKNSGFSLKLCASHLHPCRSQLCSFRCTYTRVLTMSCRQRGSRHQHRHHQERKEEDLWLTDFFSTRALHCHRPTQEVFERGDLRGGTSEAKRTSKRKRNERECFKL